MNIACPSWTKRNEHGGGNCAEGGFGGKPRGGDCVLPGGCTKHDGPWRLDARAAMLGVTVKGLPQKPIEAYRVRPIEISVGPGTELKRLLISLGIDEQPGCPCNSRMLQMNEWGAAKCLENIDEIVGWMKEAKGFLSLGTFAKAATKAISNGLAFKNLLDPVRGLVEEAIRRSTLNGS